MKMTAAKRLMEAILRMGMIDFVMTEGAKRD
jgi:hypothetical protein